MIIRKYLNAWQTITGIHDTTQARISSTSSCSYLNQTEQAHKGI